MELKIALIEDDEDMRKLVEGWLKLLRHKFEIRSFGRGDSALQFLEGEAAKASEAVPFIPDLIILDLKLPDQNGLEVLKQLKASPALQPIETIVYSSSHDPEHLRNAYRFGSCGFIRKDGDKQGLLDAVQNLLLTGRIPAKANRSSA